MSEPATTTIETAQRLARQLEDAVRALIEVFEAEARGVVVTEVIVDRVEATYLSDSAPLTRHCATRWPAKRRSRRTATSLRRIVGRGELACERLAALQESFRARPRAAAVFTAAQEVCPTPSIGLDAVAEDLRESIKEEWAELESLIHRGRHRWPRP